MVGPPCRPLCRIFYCRSGLLLLLGFALPSGSAAGPDVLLWPWPLRAVLRFHSPHARAKRTNDGAWQPFARLSRTNHVGWHVVAPRVLKFHPLPGLELDVFLHVSCLSVKPRRIPAPHCDFLSAVCQSCRGFWSPAARAVRFDITASAVTGAR